jgi:hypothetical protein
VVNNDAETFGTISVILRGNEDKAQFVGLMYDGPVPSNIVWELVRQEGDCRLLKPRTPFCEIPCTSGAVCVEDDSCMAEPNKIEAGTMTVSGLTTSKGSDPVTVNPLNYYYQVIGLVYPPFAEGDVVTVSAAGSESSPPFTLQAYGVAPLKMLNEMVIPCGDGDPVALSWEPPATNIGSRIHVLVDITYHGGTKAKIECDTDDDGSLTISGDMMDELKSFGIAGFPRVDITRITKGIDEEAKAKLTLESTLSIGLAIPGITSCNDDSDCGEGQYCRTDRRCEDIEE